MGRHQQPKVVVGALYCKVVDHAGARKLNRNENENEPKYIRAPYTLHPTPFTLLVAAAGRRTSQIGRFPRR